MKLLTVDTLEQAREKMLHALSNLQIPIESIHILQAMDRVVAEDVYAPMPVPSFRRSTVDGYSVVSKDTAGASEHLPVFLTLKGQVEMGQEALETLSSGEAIYVPTGGMIPQGADGVVMVEYSEGFGKDSVAIYDAVAPGKNLVQVGEELREADRVVAKGRKINTQDLGLLAAAGITEISVFAPVKISILSTGDELVNLGEPLATGRMYDINSHILSAKAQKLGMRIVHRELVRDSEEELLQAVEKALSDSDVVLVSGGSSQGEKDVTAKVLSRATRGGLLTHGLALKPGKPTIIAVDSQTQKLCLGLPGHPVAAWMVFDLILGWLIRQLQGQQDSLPVPAVMETGIPSDPGKTTLQQVELIPQDFGYMARPIFGKSGLIATLTRAQGYVVIDHHREGINKGEQVFVHLL